MRGEQKRYRRNQCDFICHSFTVLKSIKISLIKSKMSAHRLG